MNDAPRKIIRNTLTNSVSFAYLFLSNLFLVPFILGYLGPEYYGGIWVVIGTLTAYVGLLDFGTGQAFIKHISEYHAKDDRQALLEVVNTGIALFLGFGVVVIALSLVLDLQVLRLVGVPENIMDDARFVFRIGILVLVAANLMSPVSSILNGIQRMDVQSYIAMGVQTLNIAGTIVVLTSGYGVKGLILNNLLIFIVSGLLSGMFAFRFIPYLAFGPRYVKSARVVQLVRYGFNLQVSRLAEIVVFQTDRIIALRLFGILAATYYDISARVNSGARSASFLLVSAISPAVAELDALKDQERLAVLYVRSSKYIAVAASFFFGFVIAFAPELLVVWMGRDFVVASDLVRVLALGYFFNVITGVASSTSAGLGKTELNRRFGVFLAVVNLPLTIGCALILGPLGIAIGTTVALGSGALYFMRSFHRAVGFSSASIAALFLKPVTVAALSGLIISIAATFASPETLTRMDLLALLGVAFVLYLAFSIVFLRLWGVVDEYDRMIAVKLMKRLRFRT